MAVTKSSLIQFSALWLVLVCLKCILSAYPAQGGPLKEGQLTLQQVPRYPNLRRYYFSGDPDLITRPTKIPTENWSIVRMDELLESLNNEIGRSTPVLKIEPTVRIVKEVSTRAERLNVPYGIVEWNGRGQPQPSQIELVSPPADDSKNKEVVLQEVGQQTGASSGSNSVNYEGSLKRVPIENSRWNNLRGMWGKRSAH